MSCIRWTDDLCVGIADVDSQHQRLVDLIAELHVAMSDGRGKAALSQILSDLSEYAVSHFTLEEAYFDRHGYPDAARHREQHREFVAQVTDFRRGYEEDRLMLSLDVMDFLSNWLVGHIKGSDRAYGPFLTERGVS